MRKYIANSGGTPATFIPELDAYLADAQFGHVLGELIGKETLVQFIDHADFNGMDSMLTAIRTTSQDLDSPFGKGYIAPALLATVLLSFLMKKKLVSDLVLSSH